MTASVMHLHSYSKLRNPQAFTGQISEFPDHPMASRKTPASNEGRTQEISSTPMLLESG
jgi:hypothetical protein